MHFVGDSIMHYGLVEKAFSKEKLVKAICPVPGYDRHFNLTQSFGIEMVTVPMTEFGPDMERLKSASLISHLVIYSGAYLNFQIQPVALTQIHL
ncbi:MAG: hypothetical protein CM1200mP24_01120 [Gammaproteobacteria bacterium]|nr:MAG: hypothetical protein CM1200mP24_01120 [Gammaproteobacteria bacterium]